MEEHMANNHSISKAQRAQISIAGICVNVYFLPDATYRLAGKNVTDAIGVDHKSLGRTMRVKTLKALPHAGLNLIPIKADSGESFIPVAIEDAIVYWGIMATKGNQNAFALIVALATESLERRADSVFKIKRSEEEYEARTKLRRERVLARQSWTDQIKLRQEHHGYYRDENGKVSAKASEEYKRLTIKVNLVLFGQPHFEGNRDNMTLEQQSTIHAFETFMARWGAKYPDKEATVLVQDCLNLFDVK
jgi:hypothetical protein